MHTRKAENLPDTQLLHPHGAARQAGAVDDIPDESIAPACIVPGITLGNYRVDSVLGEGGMGVVYKAYDTLLNRIVALKVLPPRLLQNREFLHRFRTEAQAQARLNSPNVVTLYSLLEVPAGLVLVMEYVEGITLDKRIQQGPLSVDEAVHIFDQALQGVESAHQMGIVHRDLKPGNIFLTAQHEVKIMDFGVARILDNRDHTYAGSMLGTLLYIPPEQINGKEADFRSDIYTLGVSLFEAVTGRLPFERKSDYSLMHAHILEKPPSPRTLRREVPKQLETVILKAIEKDPDQRYQGACEFRAALLKHAHPGAAALLLQIAGPINHALLPASLRRSVFDRRGGKPHLLGGLGLDLLLIVLVGVLIFALGLVPNKAKPPAIDTAVHSDNPPDPAALPRGDKQTSYPQPPPAAQPRQDQRNAQPPAAAPRGAAEPRERKTNPATKKYDVLKKAWGGG